jgi:hypothetical protein
MFDILSDGRRTAAILLPKQHIFLLSHMRAYTSLFGHIMGSNPAICGYYEMHIGYYSWKSLIRQKLLYFENEETKPGFSSMFDKVLHNEHSVSAKILNGRRIKTIFSLRRPQDTIPSILKLYQSIDPSHELNSEPFATGYYIQRLDMLENIAMSLEQDFYYLDAEAMQHNPNECLGSLSDWLQLDTPLSPNYELQRNTSRARYGDTSIRMKTGRITDGKSEYANFQHDPELLNSAVRTYDRVRKLLLEKSARHSVAEFISR